MTASGTYPKVQGDILYFTEVNALADASMKGWKGDGTDGAYVCYATSGTQTLTLGSIYNFTTLTIQSGCTLNFTGYGPAIVKVSGLCAISGTINLQGNGYGGGAGGAQQTAGGNSYNVFFDYNTLDAARPGFGGRFGGYAGGPYGGGGGASIINPGAQGTSTSAGSGGVPIGGLARLKYSIANAPILAYHGMGTGGGGGGGGAVGGGGAGGAGGGCLLLFVGGSFNNASNALINVAGVTGTTVVSSNQAGGGGGGGGYVGIAYKGPTVGTPTINTSGGTGGGGMTATGSGGVGGAGTYDIILFPFSE